MKIIIQQLKIIIQQLKIRIQSKEEHQQINNSN